MVVNRVEGGRTRAPHLHRSARILPGLLTKQALFSHDEQNVGGRPERRGDPHNVARVRLRCAAGHPDHSGHPQEEAQEHP